LHNCAKVEHKITTVTGCLVLLCWIIN